MAMIASDIKDLFTLKIKSRHDTFSDQYNRVFMVKVLLASTIVTGLNWYADKINCDVPDDLAQSGSFDSYVASTCWIQGFYVYKQLDKKMNSIAYYGVPKEIAYDGLTQDNYLCRTKDAYWQRLDQKCVAMEKTYYLQYQWLPFYLCVIAALYYLPYVLYRKVNHDLIRISDIVKENSEHAKVYKFFRQAHGLRCCLTSQQILNFCIKLLYVFVNALAFYSNNKLFNGDFYYYGLKWMNWSKQNNTMQYDYMGRRDYPKPANQLIPPFGFCELYSQSKDAKTTYSDHHKFLCEISQNILYQYAMLLLWFFIIIGIVISVVGVLLFIIKYFSSIFSICCLACRNRSMHKIYERLTYRQIEYLEYIELHNVELHGEVVSHLAQRRRDYDNQNGGMEATSKKNPFLCFGVLCGCLTQ